MIPEIQIDAITIDWGDLRLFFHLNSRQDDNEGIGFDLSLIDTGKHLNNSENLIGLERNGSHLFFTLLGRQYTLIKPKSHRRN